MSQVFRPRGPIGGAFSVVPVDRQQVIMDSRFPDSEVGDATLPDLASHEPSGLHRVILSPAELRIVEAVEATMRPRPDTSN